MMERAAVRLLLVEDNPGDARLVEIQLSRRARLSILRSYARNVSAKPSSCSSTPASMRYCSTSRCRTPAGSRR